MPVSHEGSEKPGQPLACPAPYRWITRKRRQERREGIGPELIAHRSLLAFGWGRGQLDGLGLHAAAPLTG